jgi:SAM-dependent methyltransferase
MRLLPAMVGKMKGALFMDKSKFWDQVYQTKTESQYSWFQPSPTRSLELILDCKLPLDAAILDVGGGDSLLMDHLLKLGYTDITVLDISAVALAKAQARLKQDANKVSFIQSDVTMFAPNKQFALWHDRATFHFLTEAEQIEKYVTTAHHALLPGGKLIISTFSKRGPEKCSGLAITQYSEADLQSLFGKHFQCINVFEDTHTTPWGTEQSFTYASFKKEA